jgi:RNA polymerase sigma factor (sigma-70 family)
MFPEYIQGVHHKMVPVNPLIYIIDNDMAFKDYVCNLVRSVGITGEPLATSQAFLDLKSAAGPSCLMVNTRMAGIGGLGLQIKLNQLSCPIPLIVITDAVGDVASAVSAMKNGAVDFLEKPLNEQLFLDLVQHSIAKNIEHQKTRTATAAINQKLSRLTPREKQVITLCLGGITNKEIADRLGISEKTVEAHRTTTLKKMQARSLLMLAREARLIGLF